MDAARTSRRLGGNVTIVYRRTQAEMPARVEELHHALEEGIALATLRAPVEFEGNETGFVETAVIELMALGEYPFARLYAWVRERYGLNWQLSLT
jgi:glutamate synthase (NADPH/NADH) small chain